MTSPGYSVSIIRRALRRFWWVVVALTLVAGCAALAGAGLAADSQYQGEGRYIVPVSDGSASASAPLPDSSFDASGLATTYAALLTSDADLLTSLSERTGLTLEQLLENTSADVVAGTSIVDVTFTSADRAEVTRYFDALNEVLLTTPSRNIPVGNLVALYVPETVTEARTPLPLPLLGVLGGLLLGLAAALLLERIDTRLLGPTDLRHQTGDPVVDLTAVDSDSAPLLMAERTLRHVPQARRGTIVAVDNASTDLADQLAAQLAALPSVRRGNDAETSRSDQLTWQASGPFASDAGTELAVQRADVAVLLARRGASMRAVTDAIATARLLDVPAVLVAIAPARSMRRSRRQELVVDPQLPEASDPLAGRP